MPTVTETVTISRGPDDVWPTLMDVGRYDEWLTIHDGFPDGPPAALDVGGQFRQRVRIMGFLGELTWTIDAIAENAVFEMSGLGPFGARMRSAFRLSATDGGTSVSMETELEGGPLDGPLGRMVIVRLRQQARESLTNLAAIA